MTIVMAILVLGTSLITNSCFELEHKSIRYEGLQIGLIIVFQRKHCHNYIVTAPSVLASPDGPIRVTCCHN